jgi:putative transposase
VVDFVAHWSEKCEQPARKLVAWLGLGRGKFYAWRLRYGVSHEEGRLVPRDHWLEPWEREAIVDFHDRHPLEGYRRLTFMLLDANVVAVSPSSTYRVLRAAGRLDRWNRTPSRKGTGFEQPLAPHKHWHIDIAYVNVASTFFYLCTILDGYSRAVVHWELRESMREAEVEIIVQRAREQVPEARPRIISDNGPQFIARDFKSFLRIAGMTHVRTSPYYPQSNGKLERYHRTIKSDALRVQSLSSLEQARRAVEQFVTHYNAVRLHSAIDFVTPNDKLAGREREIWRERDRKLELAREQRCARRHQARLPHDLAPAPRPAGTTGGADRDPSTGSQAPQVVGIGTPPSPAGRPGSSHHI